MRVLVVTNMYPSPEHPQLGRFVQDQVRALSAHPELELEVDAFGAGGARSYLRAIRDVRRRHRGDHFDVVHAHFGLSAWPAQTVAGTVHGVTLHGTDLSHPRSRPITLAALRRMDVVGVVSEELAGKVPRRATSSPVRVLPCGADLDRFRLLDRRAARSALGLDPDRPHLLFPADPARPEKRYDLAAAIAQALGVRLLTMGKVDPDDVPLFVNAANAVLVTSEREGFGLAAIEALACDVPVLATPHGVAPEALAGIDGTLCAPFSQELWRDHARRCTNLEDPRVRGRARAEAYSAARMAERLLEAWREALERTEAKGRQGPRDPPIMSGSVRPYTRGRQAGGEHEQP